MSDEQADQTAAPVKKPGRAKLILLAGAVLLLLLAGGGVVAFFMGLIPIGSAAIADQSTQSEMTRENIVFVDLPELLVNLNATGRRLHFLKLATALEVSGEEQAA